MLFVRSSIKREKRSHSRGLEGTILDRSLSLSGNKYNRQVHCRSKAGSKVTGR